MSIEALRLVLGRPESPLETGSVIRWSEVERLIGTGMPADFKQFVEEYGTGRIAELLYVLNPFSANSNLNMIDEVPHLLQALKTIKANHPAEVQYEIFPQPAGLLPWAYSDNGDVLYWLTRGKPDSWTVVVQDTSFTAWEDYPFSMSVFLERLLSGAIQSKILGPLSDANPFQSDSFLV